RKGAQLAFAYAQANVPRVCVVLRKAYGGAYIVMDSKRMGNDLCVAWPGAEIAVMGSQQAVQILHRALDPEAKAERQLEYEQTLLFRRCALPTAWCARSTISLRRPAWPCCAPVVARPTPPSRPAPSSRSRGNTRAEWAAISSRSCTPPATTSLRASTPQVAPA